MANVQQEIPATLSAVFKAALRSKDPEIIDDAHRTFAQATKDAHNSRRPDHVVATLKRCKLRLKDAKNVSN